MKYVTGMGVVASDGRVLMGTGSAPTAANIAYCYEENAALRKLVLIVAAAGQSPEHREAALQALVLHEVLYGRLDHPGQIPAGLVSATKETK